MTMIMITDTTATTHIVMARSKGTPARPPVHVSPAAGAAPALVPEYAALYRLMTWLSPSFPVGAFSYSSGIEWAVEAGDISDAPSLQVCLCHAWRAAAATDDDALAAVAELAAAFTPSRERHLETTAQGRAFADITAATWTCDALTRLMRLASGPIAYPVAVGAVAAGHGVRLEWSLHAFLHAQAANWISAGVRLIPLGQTDSQRVMAALEPIVAFTATRALQANLDDIASATFRADLASMRHETQYTRLFRT
jgi:urease accessory protein